MAMSILGDEFVCAKNISDLEHSTIVKNENCSFDMLGEAARNEVQALKFLVLTRNLFMLQVNLISKQAMIMVSQLSFLHFTQNMIYFIKMMLMKSCCQDSEI